MMKNVIVCKWARFYIWDSGGIHVLIFQVYIAIKDLLSSLIYILAGHLAHSCYFESNLSVKPDDASTSCYSK